MQKCYFIQQTNPKTIFGALFQHICTSYWKLLPFIQSISIFFTLHPPPLSHACSLCVVLKHFTYNIILYIHEYIKNAWVYYSEIKMLPMLNISMEAKAAGSLICIYNISVSRWHFSVHTIGWELFLSWSDNN